MTDGVLDPGFDTVKVSVRHCDAAVASVAPSMSVATPANVVPITVVSVDGPEIVNWLKSSRNWQMFSLHRQISMVQAPVSAPVDSK